MTPLASTWTTWPILPTVRARIRARRTWASADTSYLRATNGPLFGGEPSDDVARCRVEAPDDLHRDEAEVAEALDEDDDTGYDDDVYSTEPTRGQAVRARWL